MNRRFFLLAAPAIVAAPSLMRVSVMPQALAADREPVEVAYDTGSGNFYMLDEDLWVRLDSLFENCVISSVLPITTAH